MFKKIVHSYCEDIKIVTPVNDIYRQIADFLTIDPKVVSIVILNLSDHKEEGVYVEAIKLGQKYINTLDQDILYLINSLLERPINTGIVSNDNKKQQDKYFIKPSMEVKLHKQYTYDTRSEVNGIIGTFYSENLSSEYIDILKPLSQIVGNSIVVNQIRTSEILQQYLSG